LRIIPVSIISKYIVEFYWGFDALIAT
jgi:hypothetical protein